MAACTIFRARGGDRFSARLGVEGGALRVGSERDAANLVGTRAGGFALEPRTLRRVEVRVLLLPGIGAGVDARAGSLAGHHLQRNASNYKNHRADSYLVHRGVLPAARIAGVDRRLEIFRARSSRGAREKISCGGRLKRQSDELGSRELKSGELEEVTHAVPRSAAFFDIDGTLLARPSLERRFFWELQRRRKIPARNYLAWLAETIRLGLPDPRQLRAVAQTNKSYLRGVHAEIPYHANSFNAHAGDASPSDHNPSNATSCAATFSNTTRGSADRGSETAGKWLPEFFPAAIQRACW